MHNFILQHFYLQKIKADCKPRICWCCFVKYKGILAALQGLKEASGGRARWDSRGTARWRGSHRPGQVLISPSAALESSPPKPGPISLMSRWKSISKMNPLPLAKTKGVALSLQLVESGQSIKHTFPVTCQRASGRL